MEHVFFNQSKSDRIETRYRKSGRSVRFNQQRSPSGSYGASDAPVGGGAAKPVKPSSAQRSIRVVPKALTSQSASMSSESAAAANSAKASGDASKGSHFLFGSIGMQIPARTSSTPPNLDEQKCDQARHDTYRSVPNLPTPSIPKQQLPKKDPGVADQSDTGEVHQVPKVKKDASVPLAPAASQTRKSSVLPTPITSMQMPFHQSLVSVQFGGHNPPIQSQNVTATSLQKPMPIPLPLGSAPQVQQHMFVPGLQPHPMQQQGIMHQRQGLSFTTQIGPPQLPPQLGNLGMGITPQYPQQQGGKYVGPRKTIVKMTHTDTHKEVRLDEGADTYSDGGMSAARPHSNVPQSQPIPSSAPAHPINYYPNSYNPSSTYFATPSSLPLTNSQMAPNSQAPRFNYPIGQGSQNVSFMNPAALISLPVSKSGTQMPGVAEPPNLDGRRKESISGSNSIKDHQKKSVKKGQIQPHQQARGKKKRKEFFLKADSAGTTSDLYMACKGPEEKKEIIMPSESSKNNPTNANLKHLPADAAPADAVAREKSVQSKTEPDDRWQHATNFQQKGLIPSHHTPSQIMHRAEKKYEVGKVAYVEEAKQRRLKAILRKLTPQNFEKLFEQVKAVNIDNSVTLARFVSQIFDKALMEPTFCEMYANLCSHLAGELPDFSKDNEKITFKRLFLNKCQEEFERGEREQEANKDDIEGEVKHTAEEREEKRIKARRRMLGNIRLIGELYKTKMLTERIMHECIKKLLGQYENPEEEDVEALCELMSTIGERIDHPKAKEHMDAYFDVMSKLSNNMKLSSWVRFMLKDAIELRNNKWQRATNFQQKGLILSPHTPLQIMHRAEKKYEVGKVADEEEAKQRRLKAILNKLTPQNFEKLFEQVKAVNIDNSVTLAGVISQIFDKAVMEPTFCEIYANFCYYLAGELPDFSKDNEKITFKRLLLNKCQEEFERGEREQEEATEDDKEREVKQTAEEREEKRIKARRRMLGNIRLIGELYKKKMLTERVMHECIKKLLGQYENPDEEDVEALCELMSSIGEMIDHPHPKAKEHMDAYFDAMSKFSNHMKLSSKVRFMLKDAIELRNNKWQRATNFQQKGLIPL